MYTSTTIFEPLEARRLLAASPGIDGIGVLGDSYSDEYQFYPGARATAANWIEQLAADSNVSFGALSPTDPPGPRNEGYAYNWAVDNATTADLPAQAAGVAAQAAPGAVDLAVMFIGGNDFRHVFQVLQIEGPAAALEALAAAVPQAASNIAQAVGTILTPQVLSANPEVKLVLTTIPKLSHLPVIRGLLEATPQLAPFVAAVDDARAVVNQQIVTIASGSGRIAVADFASLIDDVFARNKLKVANIEIERFALENRANDPRHFMLGDGLHPGTVTQGLLANLIVRTANRAFGTHIERLSKRDILENAGLAEERHGRGCGPTHHVGFSAGPGITAEFLRDADELPIRSQVHA